MMRFGAVFPTMEIPGGPGEIARWATGAEHFGFDHLVVCDRVAARAPGIGRNGFSTEDRFHEVFVLLGYLAALTASAELVTSVLVLPQRQPVLVAKQAAEVDVLSEGRLRLGVGVGQDPVGYEALGEEFTDRGARCAEQIRLLRALWADPVVTFHGDWYGLHETGINPRPVRGDVPVWIGGESERTLRRIGELGDGWFPQRMPDPEAARLVRRIRTTAQTAGRAVAEIGIEPTLDLGRVPRAGWAGFVRGWARLGATHLSINTGGIGLDDVDEHLGMLRAALGMAREALKQ
jgi:probable F420-dependent oxidoreductase